MFCSWFVGRVSISVSSSNVSIIASFKSLKLLSLRSDALFTFHLFCFHFLAFYELFGRERELCIGTLRVLFVVRVKGLQLSRLIEV